MLFAAVNYAVPDCGHRNWRPLLHPDTCPVVILCC